MRQHCREHRPAGWAGASGRLCGLLVALAILLPAPADAGRHAVSQRPHWEVGALDAELSRACRRQHFNQIVDHRLFIAYAGDRGTGVTGVAKRGWNLRDPEGRAAPDATYHFADDGLSTCRVYVAREPRSPASPGSPAGSAGQAPASTQQKAR